MSSRLFSIAAGSAASRRGSSGRSWGSVPILVVSGYLLAGAAGRAVARRAQTTR
jgi:hypothetical protein